MNIDKLLSKLPPDIQDGAIVLGVLVLVATVVWLVAA